MYFLDNNSGVNAMPAIAPVNSASVRWFTEGSGSLPPSWPGMDWFNIIQAELIGVLTAAGMSPDKARVDQLAAAIKSIIGSDALLKKNYLSEIKEAGATAQSSARGNLGLGTAATKNTGLASGNVMEVGAFGLASSLPTLSSVNLDTFDSFGFYVVRDAINAPMSDKGVWFLSIRVWDSKSGADPFRIVQIAEGYGSSGSLRNRSFHRVYSGSAVGWSAWVEFYSEAHKPTAQDAGALPITGGTLTGQLGVNNADFINKNGYTTYTDGSGKQHRQAGGLRLTIADTILTELYYNETVGNSAEVSLHNKYGSTDSYLSLRNDGQVSISGTNPQITISNGTVFATDGNVKGSVWDNGYLSNWILNKANDAKNAAIDWANTNCARKPTSWLQPTGWFRDTTTGLITQWGIVTRGGGTTRVWFPNAFPNACVSVQLTLRNSSSGGSSFNIFANGEDGQGFNYISSDNEVQAFWMAVGY